MTLQVGPTRCMCGGVPRARGDDRTAEATSGDQPITIWLCQLNLMSDFIDEAKLF